MIKRKKLDLCIGDDDTWENGHQGHFVSELRDDGNFGAWLFFLCETLPETLDSLRPDDQYPCQWASKDDAAQAISKWWRTAERPASQEAGRRFLEAEKEAEMAKQASKEV